MGRMCRATGAADRPRMGAVSAIFILVLAVSLALAACGATDRTATGVVIGLDASAGKVRSFTVRTTDGLTMQFVIGSLATDADAFPAAHLAEHAATLGPVVVSYRVEGDRNVVYRLTDAPEASPS